MQLSVCGTSIVRHSGRDAGPARARSESSHMDVKVQRPSVPLNNARDLKVTLHGAGYRHPCRYDGSGAVVYNQSGMTEGVLFIAS